MITQVKAKLDNLSDYKKLVVVTYTNAATEKLSRALVAEMSVHPNIFIGTIHSFLNEFIVQPYARLFGIAGGETLVFLESLELTKPTGAIHDKAIAEKIGRNAGLITFDQIEWIAKKLVCDKDYIISTKKKTKIKFNPDKLSKLIANRIQYLFIDEYQDATSEQASVFNKLSNADYIDEVYFVGDPEQYIYGFTNQGKREVPDYNDIPINVLKSDTTVTTVTNSNNHRSSNEIVTFINNFAANKQEIPKQNGKKVEFIGHTDVTEIISYYKEISQKYTERFVLATTLNIVPQDILKDGYTISNTSTAKRPITGSLELIGSILQKSKKEIMTEKNLDELNYRTIGLAVYRKLINNELENDSDLLKFLNSEFGLSPSKKGGVRSTIKQESFIVFHRPQNITLNIKYANIHKAKGLEADTVLIIARSNSELTKWLEIDQIKRARDKIDSCRLGYVAFSRAKVELYLACLQELSEKNQKALKGLGIMLPNYNGPVKSQLEFSLN